MVLNYCGRGFHIGSAFPVCSRRPAVKCEAKVIAVEKLNRIPPWLFRLTTMVPPVSPWHRQNRGDLSTLTIMKHNNSPSSKHFTGRGGRTRDVIISFMSDLNHGQTRQHIVKRCSAFIIVLIKGQICETHSSLMESQQAEDVRTNPNNTRTNMHCNARVTSD